MDLLLLTQYFDMLRDVGQSSRAATVFLPHAPQSVAALQSAMRDGFMQVCLCVCECECEIKRARHPPPPSLPLSRFYPSLRLARFSLPAGRQAGWL